MSNSTVVKSFITLFVILPIFGLGVSPRILVDLWRWFVVPLGVGPLTHWHAFGLLLLLGFAKMSEVRMIMAKMAEDYLGEDNYMKALNRSIIGVCLMELVIWGIGYLVAN